MYENSAFARLMDSGIRIDETLTRQLHSRTETGGIPSV